MSHRAVVAGEVAADEGDRPGTVDQLVEAPARRPDKRPAGTAQRGAHERRGERRPCAGTRVAVAEPAKAGPVAKRLAEQRPQRVRVDVVDNRLRAVLEAP